jgi:hypothetical protein
VKIVKNVAPPTGLSRLLFRIPIYVYRLGMGWLFGDRLMLLNHIGRVSGKQRATVLEVVTHDLADDSFVVASGWGPPQPGIATLSTHQRSASRSADRRYR